jgi:F0F1-type ATP synthase gamma subunit
MPECTSCGQEVECCKKAVLPQPMEQPPLTPMSRDTMRQLKQKKDEENRLILEKFRLQEIQNLVKDIYNSTLYYASSREETSAQYTVVTDRGISGLAPEYNSLRYSYGRSAQAHLFSITKNMKEIISGLEELFPGCSVRHLTINDTHQRQDRQGNFPKQTIITIDWS